MKKIFNNIAAFFILAILILFASCSPSTTPSRRVVSVTILPQLYFAEQIAGDRFEVNCVVPVNASPEAYDPSPQQIIDVARSEAYMYVGGLGFENVWLEKLSRNNPHMVIYNTSQGIDRIKSLHSHTHSDGTVHNSVSVDPHVWCSPDNARKMAYNICEAFVELDADGEAYYRSNCEMLVQRIDSVRVVMDDLLGDVSGRAFAIYHPSLSYLARDYGLEQICLENMGKENSAVELKNAVNRAFDANVEVVFIQREFNTKQIETFAQEVGAEMVTINPLNYDWTSEMLRIAYAIAQQ